MDNKKPAEKNRSSRSLRTLAIGVGALAVAAAGGAYYFPEYLPLWESPAAIAAPPVAAKPRPVTPKSTVNSAAALPSPSVAILSVAHATQQPAQVASASVPAAQNSAKPAKPGQVAKQRPAVRKVSATTKPAPKAKKRRKAKRVAKPEHIAKADTNLDPREVNQEVAPPQDMLLKPAFPQAEPPAEPPPMIPVEPEPAPMPAPVETIPVAPAETAPAAPPEPDSAPRVTVPKYNDLATAVLRGDREAARELLDLGWWVDKPSASGVTPLMAAVMNRDTAMVILLLEYGAEPTAQALALARKNKDDATAALLELKGAR